MNILITGGASGLGEYITTKLAQDKSNKIYFTYCRSKSKADKLTKKFKNCHSVNCDFTNPESLSNLCNQINKLDIDILINNALVSFSPQSFHRLDPNFAQQSFLENILHIIKITKECIKIFQQKKFGKIITILSSAVTGNPPINLSLYTAEKNYLWSLCKSWAIEYKAFNISSNTVSPHLMKIGINKDLDSRVITQIQKNSDLSNPETVAEAVSFFVNAPQQINNNNLII